MTLVVLDTNAFCGYTKGDRRVLEILGKAKAVLMPIFVLGELYAGFRGGTRLAGNLHVLRGFLDEPNVNIPLPGQETADLYGQITATLKRAGTPIPTNDVWVAAQAMEHGAVVVSYDRHFLKVPGLRIWPELEFSQQR